MKASNEKPQRITTITHNEDIAKKLHSESFRTKKSKTSIVSLALEQYLSNNQKDANNECR